MGIFDRVGKVISSNVNSLLDKAEDPRKSVRLLIEEMHEQIRRGRQEVVSAVATGKQLAKKVDELGEQVDKWQRRAELAIQAGDETLAREALVHKKRITEERDRAEALRSEHKSRALGLKDDLERAQAKLQELEAREATIVARYEQARAGGGAEALGAKGTGPTPFDELRRIEDQIERKDLEAEAMREARDVLDKPAAGSMSAAELDAKFAALENAAQGKQASGNTPGGDPDIDEQLQALRKKFRVAP